MQCGARDLVSIREEIICRACDRLARDLRMIPPLSYANLFHFGQTPAAYNEICRIIEIHFPSGNLMFNCSGDALMAWNATPVIALDLEYSDSEVNAFFRLVLNGEQDCVELHHIAFIEDGKQHNLAHALQNNERLTRTLENSRSYS